MKHLAHLLLSIALCAVAAHAAPIKVASLNPIVSDLARQVGGTDVEVFDLMPLGSNPHTFNPTPDDLKIASNAQIILAAGKGLETYLEDVIQSLGDIPVFEAGRSVPSLRVEVGEVFICCPAHAAGSIDPHWWHSVKSAKRAAKGIADKLAEIDAGNAEAYDTRYRAYAEKLDGLYKWAKSEISRIPRRDRELTTSHAAFGYLCREFGLRSITIQGLNTEDNPNPSHLKDVVKTLEKQDVRAVFPEDNANPKVMSGMVRETGVKVGGKLYAGTLPPASPTYVDMVRSNITTIVNSLAGNP
ncbi:MAG: zinc ABC transporter substrate-binding protein [Lentisphaerae bacterium]|nr:zinc ABC transporter substrate-binding protein [Lentisphaerota bacterium]